MKLITEKKWNSIADFNKYVNKDGDHFITKFVPEKGTCLIPVVVEGKLTEKVSDKQKRKIYKKAFGKEYDENRQQVALPLDIAYQVALYRLKKLKEGKLNKLVLGKNQKKALAYYESGHNMWYDRGYYWDNSTTIMVYNKKLATHEIENAVDIARDNQEDGDWEYKSLSRLLERI